MLSFNMCISNVGISQTLSLLSLEPFPSRPKQKCGRKEAGRDYEVETLTAVHTFYRLKLVLGAPPLSCALTETGSLYVHPHCSELDTFCTDTLLYMLFFFLLL